MHHLAQAWFLYDRATLVRSHREAKSRHDKQPHATGWCVCAQGSAGWTCPPNAKRRACFGISARKGDLRGNAPSLAHPRIPNAVIVEQTPPPAAQTAAALATTTRRDTNTRAAERNRWRSATMRAARTIDTRQHVSFRQLSSASGAVPRGLLGGTQRSPTLSRSNPTREQPAPT